MKLSSQFFPFIVSKQLSTIYNLIHTNYEKLEFFVVASNTKPLYSSWLITHLSFPLSRMKIHLISKRAVENKC